MRRPRSVRLAFALVGLIGGCVGRAPVDGGAPADAGPEGDADAGGRVDAGSARDAGAVDDGGPLATDAGGDGGPAPDAGEVEDAGPLVLPDGGPAPDAGPCGTIALVDDAFDPGTLRAQWTATFGGGFGATSVEGGVLRMDTTAGAVTSHAPAVATVAAYRLAAGALDVDVVELPSSSAPSEAVLRLDARTIAYEMYATGGALAVRSVVDGGVATIGSSTTATAPARWRVEAQDGGWSFGTVVDGGFDPLAVVVAPAVPMANVALSLRGLADAGPTGSFAVTAVDGHGEGDAFCPADGLDEGFDDAALSAEWTRWQAGTCSLDVAGSALVASCGPGYGIGYIQTRAAYDLRDSVLDVELDWPFDDGALVQVSSATTARMLDVYVGDTDLGADMLAVALPEFDAYQFVGSEPIAPTSTSVVVRIAVAHDGAVTVILLDDAGPRVVARAAAGEVGVEAGLVRLGPFGLTNDASATRVIRVERVSTTWAP